MTRLLTVATCIGLLASARLAAGQQLPGFQTSKQFKIERIGKDYVKLTGSVEAEDRDLKLFADTVEIYSDKDRAVATGNVVVVEGTSQIAADRADFNYKTRLGTFYHATGTAQLQQKKGPGSMFGTQEPDIYFYGDEIEKVGLKKYRITRGGFTTCLQPTPRWEVTSSTVIISLEHYAVLRNSLLRVKSVPVFYLPIFYYPVKKDDRATGFLLPTYGTSTVQGFRFSDAFFWAINRSQDAVFEYDWFKNSGQGFGGEYRYIEAPGSQGNARFAFLDQRETTVTNSAGDSTTLPATRSYEIHGSMVQSIAPGIIARGRADYFSSIQAQQIYNTNIYDSSRRQRVYSGNVSAARSGWVINGTWDRSEYFFGQTNSSVTGGEPRISASRSERPLFGTPFYFSFGTEFVSLVRQNLTGDSVSDNGLTRLDVMPTVRIPFTKLPFLTVNSWVSWRDTYYSRSWEGAWNTIDVPVSRRYWEFNSQVTGPVFNRVWNTPDNGYSEKWKHTIQPYFNVQYRTAVDTFDQIPQLEGTDAVVGNVTGLSYGINNRLYAKPKQGPAAGSSREIVSVAIGQSYYTDARQAAYDRQVASSFNGVPLWHYTPIVLTARVSPTDQVNATMRAEYDTQFGAFRTISANGTYAVGNWLQTSAGWSQQRYVPGLRGFNDPTRLTHYLNGAAVARLLDNRYGVTYTFNYDLAKHEVALEDGTSELRRGGFLQQRLVGYYNAQCCGFAVEYQVYNYGQSGVFASLASPTGKFQDRRFNFSFTLAGIGTFSNLFGALGGGQPR